MDTRRPLGEAGERLAAAHLEARGYRIVARNVRCREGEIDIVARDPVGVLVFVEVRTRRGLAAGDRAAASVGPRKQRRLQELAGAYLAEHALADETDARIDVITIAVSDGGRVLGVDHIENAVEG